MISETGSIEEARAENCGDDCIVIHIVKRRRNPRPKDASSRVRSIETGVRQETSPHVDPSVAQRGDPFFRWGEPIAGPYSSHRGAKIVSGFTQNPAVHMQGVGGGQEAAYFPNLDHKDLSPN